jgi:hypothetical protein
MSIFSARRSIVHPYARPRKVVRPFAEGLELDPTPVNGIPAIEATPTRADAIPADAQRVLYSGNLYERTGKPGAEWKMIEERVWVGRRMMNRVFREGLADIVQPDQVQPTGPGAGAFQPTEVESAWFTAFNVFADGEPGNAPAGSSDEVIAAWEDGALHGARAYDAHIELAAENDLLMSMATGQHIPDGEWLEARIVPPV